MKLLLYYVLRRFFVKLETTDSCIILEKGIFLKRKTRLPLKSIVRATFRRSIPARILGAEEIMLYTLRGKLEFFLPKNHVPISEPARFCKFSPWKIAFGAFIDTRALGGIVIFAVILRKIGVILGGDYSRKLVALLFETAENVSHALAVVNIAVPGIAAAAGIFALASWLFAFVRKLFRLARFRSGSRGGYYFVKSGIITLYEHIIVRNSVVFTDTVMTLITNRSPMYCHRVMICPAVRRPGKRFPAISPPKSSFWGRCAVPLWCLAGFSAALVLLESSAEFRKMLLLKTALYSGFFVSLYVTALFAAYMKRSALFFGKRAVRVSERRGMRLYTCIFPAGAVVSQSVSRRFSGLCNVEFRTAQREKIFIRLIPENCLRR